MANGQADPGGGRGSDFGLGDPPQHKPGTVQACHPQRGLTEPTFTITILYKTTRPGNGKKVAWKPGFWRFGGTAVGTCQAARARRACGMCCGGVWVLVWYKLDNLGRAEGLGLARSKSEKSHCYGKILRWPGNLEFWVSGSLRLAGARPHARGGRAACVAEVFGC